MIENGMSLFERAAIFNIPALSTIIVLKKTIRNTRNRCPSIKEKGCPSMKKESNKQSKQAPVEGSVKARIQQLKMENEYLKKLNTLVQNKEKSRNRTKC